MKKVMITTLAIVFFITGCGGVMRSADPTIPYRPTDTGMDCQQIENEMAMSRERYAQFVERKHLKTAQNVAMAATGFFFIVPFFFMDSSSVDDTNLKSEQARYKVLTDMASGTQCEFAIPPIKGSVKKVKKAEIQHP